MDRGNRYLLAIPQLEERDWEDPSTLHVIMEVEEALFRVISDRGMARMLTVESLSWMCVYEWRK